jgi:hypothetical protein
MRDRSKRTNSPAVLAMVNGFVATKWIDGKRLTAQSVNDDILRQLAHYIAASTQPPMSKKEATAALERLADMTCCNAGEALGYDDVRRPTIDSETRTYGDARMAPHEWVKSADGTIFKTDCVGHDCDHTVIGKQPVYWDIAGAIVEWDLNETQCDQFLAHCAAEGLPVREDQLSFHQIAYAAFRLGFCKLNESLSDETEKVRLQAAGESYGIKLSKLIRTSFSKRFTMLIEPGLISTRAIKSSDVPRK